MVVPSLGVPVGLKRMYTLSPVWSPISKDLVPALSVYASGLTGVNANSVPVVSWVHPFCKWCWARVVLQDSWTVLTVWPIVLGSLHLSKLKDSRISVIGFLSALIKNGLLSPTWNTAIVSPKKDNCFVYLISWYC